VADSGLSRTDHRPLHTLLRWLNFRRSVEVFFVSYPKTGNTWVRYLLGRYLQLVCGTSEVMLFDGNDWLGRCERACLGPRIYFTHEPLTWQSQEASGLNDRNVTAPYRAHAVVLLARYPLDVLVSAWCHRRFRSRECFREGLEAFITHPVMGLEKLFRFYELWAADCAKGKFFLLRYEDLRTDTHGRFRELLRFLGIAPQEPLLDQAVRDASFEAMKALELSGEHPRYRWSGLDIFGGSNPEVPESLQVRRGEVGGYVQYLDPAEVRRYEALVSARMPALYGYAHPPH
jgi:hypothetical protein